MKTTDIRAFLERRKGQRLQLQDQIQKSTRSIKEGKRELEKHEEAKEIIREVGIKTQRQLQFHIADITSLALEAVFTNPYRLEVEFVQRRNKTECDIFFVREEHRVDPLSASGGGAVDIAAFALRIASWSLSRPNTRNTIILDEPMRFVSENLRDKASQMIKEVSKKLGIQFIIITHDPMLAAYADKVFEVSIRKGISKIKTDGR